jgi:BCD family chlorophyll transporter-like MFS transporter
MWGASQAIAFGTGGFLGTVLADLGRLLMGGAAGQGSAYALVFGLEAIAFVAAAWMALHIRIGRAVTDAATNDTNVTIANNANDRNTNKHLELTPRMEGSD